MSDILVTYQIDPLNGMSADEAISAIKEKLTGRVKEAYYFGSFRTPAFTKFSDIDLLLVVETTVPFIERPVQFTDLLDLLPNLDILVYTPIEFRRLTTDPSPGFWSDVSKSLVQFI